MRVGDQMFIGYPSAVQFKTKGSASSKKGKTPINQLLWGDWAKVKQISGDWIKVRARGRDGWVRVEDLQSNRILEVNFVDVAQGDGAHIQTPDDAALVIDAGQEDNMFRFLRWRFNMFPAFRRSGGRITYISRDLKQVRIKLPLNWKTRNYVGTIYGGSMYAAIDPVYMAMLMKLLGANYVIWDKAAAISQALTSMSSTGSQSSRGPRP